MNGGNVMACNSFILIGSFSCGLQNFLMLTHLFHIPTIYEGDVSPIGGWGGSRTAWVRSLGSALGNELC